jgi:hypothetical protein
MKPTCCLSSSMPPSLGSPVVDEPCETVLRKRDNPPPWRQCASQLLPSRQTTARGGSRSRISRCHAAGTPPPPPLRLENRRPDGCQPDRAPAVRAGDSGSGVDDRDLNRFPQSTLCMPMMRLQICFALPPAPPLLHSPIEPAQRFNLRTDQCHMLH